MAPTRTKRAMVAIAVALCTGVIAYLKQRQAPAAWIAGDYTFHWRAAKALLDGSSPYAVIQPTGAYPWNDGYRYPLPAAVLVLPIAWLQAQVSAALFLAISAGLLAFGITRSGFHRLLAFASVPFIYCFTGSQLTPIMMAGALTPAIGGVLAIKPTIGLALFMGWPNRKAVIGGCVLLLASFAFVPRWPVEWFHAATARSGTEANYEIPLLLVGGPLLLLAASRWRRPEARLLLGMALVPQSFFFYDQFPLALVPQSRREHLTFGVLSVVALVSCWFLLPAKEVSLAQTTHTVATVCLLCLFLPCLAMILARPNEGAVPEWLERFIESWPDWLRGRSAGPRNADA